MKHQAFFFLDKSKKKLEKKCVHRMPMPPPSALSMSALMGLYKWVENQILISHHP